MKEISWENYYEKFYDWSESTQKNRAHGLTNYGPVDEVFTRISKKLGIDIFEDEDAGAEEPNEDYEDYPEERPVKTGFLYKPHGSYQCSRRN